MLSVKIGKETIDFKNSFDEITVEDFAQNIDFENKIDNILKQIEALEKDRNEFEGMFSEIDKIFRKGGGTQAEADKVKSEELLRQIEFIEADIVQKSFAVKMLRISQISLLTDNPKKTENFLLSTKGIDGEILSKIYTKIQDGFGNMNEYFLKVKAVKSFKYKDFRRHGILRLKKCIFEVKDLDRQTVIRDAGATIVAQKIGTFAKEFQSNNWRNFARFVAYVARPKKEQFEYFPRRSRFSFIGGKRFETMSAADRLSTYNKKLEEAVEARSKIFEKLPISKAIGIYKYYFLLKKNFPQTTKNYTRKTEKQQNKLLLT